jgi:putative flippase GtrA
MSRSGGVDYGSLRHWGGFVVTGGGAFLIDAGVTAGLIYLAGLDPFTSRLFGIGVAMVFAWLMHRRVTFNVAAPPSAGEFLRFAAVAGSANALNYAIYALTLLVWPATPPLVALLASTAIAACASYVGFRFGVFRRPGG